MNESVISGERGGGRSNLGSRPYARGRDSKKSNKMQSKKRFMTEASGAELLKE